MVWNMWQWINTLPILTTAFQELYSYVSLDDLGLIQKSITSHRLGATFEGFSSQLGVWATFISYQRKFDVTKIYTVQKIAHIPWSMNRPLVISRSTIFVSWHIYGIRRAQFHREIMPLGIAVACATAGLARMARGGAGIATPWSMDTK